MGPQDLFVFAGAGASRSSPAGLPLFNWIRDELLLQLELPQFVEGTPVTDPTKVAVAAALAPEPFMSDLMAGGIDVERWLDETLCGGSPNAVHHALAALGGGRSKGVDGQLRHVD
jgi:hypothetical protein